MWLSFQFKEGCFLYIYSRSPGMFYNMFNCIILYFLPFSELFLGANMDILEIYTVKSVISGHSKTTPNLGFNTDFRLMEVKSIAECSKGSILQYV